MKPLAGSNLSSEDGVAGALGKVHGLGRQLKSRLNDLTHGRSVKAIPADLSPDEDSEEDGSGDEEFEDAMEEQFGAGRGGRSRRGGRGGS